MDLDLIQLHNNQIPNLVNYHPNVTKNILYI
nr:MAG TPA: hypothetical protein [Caudoviricetes sp.]DAU59310.1 MAG TPA: hypothetical protein [Crassvirales sp.]